MINKIANTRSYFFISIFLHLFFLLILLLFLKPPSEKIPPAPHQFIPAYTYTNAAPPLPKSASPLTAAKPKQTNIEPRELPSPSRDIVPTMSSHGLSRGVKSSSQKSTPHSFLAASQQMLKQYQYEALTEARKTAEPIYLIGDLNNPPDPLLQLLGKALSLHFKYPRTAGMFGIKGRVIINLVLHPEGYITNVVILQSSQHNDLDSAALFAVNQAPLVKGANHFLNEPKHFTIGFIFK
jgi:TonB family protein